MASIIKASINLNNIDKSKIIDAEQLRSIFDKNNFIKDKIGYYRLALPPDMMLTQEIDQDIGGEERVVKFNNIFVELKIVISYLPPENKVYCEIALKEKPKLVFCPKTRREYNKWFNLLVKQMKSIEIKNSMTEAVIKSLKESEGKNKPTL